MSGPDEEKFSGVAAKPWDVCAHMVGTDCPTLTRSETDAGEGKCAAIAIFLIKKKQL